jgi:hypothetical protein
MKNRILKVGVIILFSALIMINIDLLFETDKVFWMQSSSVKASDEILWDYFDNTELIPLHKLTYKPCWQVDLEVGAFVIYLEGIPIPIPYPKGISVNNNKWRWVCKKEQLPVNCDPNKQTECKETKEMVEEEVPFEECF